MSQLNPRHYNIRQILRYFCVIWLAFTALITLRVSFIIFAGAPKNVTPVYVAILSMLFLLNIFWAIPNLISAYGIAMDKKWGYRLGIVVTGVFSFFSVLALGKSHAIVEEGSLPFTVPEIFTLIALIYLNISHKQTRNNISETTVFTRKAN